MESTGRLGRKDTTKGPPLRILSLDGGGVRGYSMLIIIQELMHLTYVESHGSAPRRDQIPKPCEHFDLIVGTGTGGLIAIMLGRLRLDLETCKEVYVRMTRKVFETDKTIAGIPYRSTLFKASKLEEAIKECVREHTVSEKEGNDGESVVEDLTPTSPVAAAPPPIGVQRHASNASVVSFSARSPSSYGNRPFLSQWGNQNALLYDTREHRTKTAVTAVYKGSAKGTPPAFLRSYDSRREPPPEFDCTIWQAGRATSAIGLAFKPIQIGQSVFIDEGSGQYNPSPFVLDEATINEWPGREVGVFVSVGTGKRPRGSDTNQHLWYEGLMGEYAEARRRLISKIEGCEVTHQHMLKEYLAKRGVDPSNYYRLNVEVNVGEFGMNEWNRLAEISTGTKRYLRKPDVQTLSHDAAAKLAKIYLAKRRLEVKEVRLHPQDQRMGPLASVPEVPPSFAIELPAEVPCVPQRITPPLGRPSFESGDEANSLSVQPLRLSPRTSSENERRRRPISSSGGGAPTAGTKNNNDDRFVVNAPTPAQYSTAAGQDKIAIMSLDEYPRPPLSDHPSPRHQPQQMAGPPPIPPKTPIQAEGRMMMGAFGGMGMGAGGGRLPPPYPLDDRPPVVNMARKPAEYRRV